MEITFENLVLREYSPKDLEAFIAFETLPQTYQFEPQQPSLGSIKQYLADAISWSKNFPRTKFRFLISIPGSDHIIGRMKLILFNSATREWEIGWAVHPDYWGKGYASQAAIGLMNYAFQELNAHRLIAFANEHNKASIKVMQKLKMQQDGLLRESLWWHDSWSDEVVYSILDKEWKSSQIIPLSRRKAG